MPVPANGKLSLIISTGKPRNQQKNNTKLYPRNLPQQFVRTWQFKTLGVKQQPEK
jgi:hypothetical protein